LPLEVTMTDVIQIPIAIVNSSSDKLSVKLNHKFSGSGLAMIADKSKNNFFNGKQAISVSVDERKRLLLDVDVKFSKVPETVTLTAEAGVFHDQVVREVKIVPLGFPRLVTHSGLLEGGTNLKFEFEIPKGINMSCINTSLQLLPSPMSNLTAALQALMTEPFGCFEQTSSTTYPTVIAHQYLMSQHDVDPGIIKRSSDLIEKGYKRLTSYECRSGGYEWFGKGDGHEALTAYGCLEFLDMSKVYPVDKQMLDRTLKWLYGRKDGNGGFLRNKKQLDSFGGAAQDITNAYILWTLTEGGEAASLLETEINALQQDALKKTDTYLLGLSAGCLYNVGRSKEGKELAEKMIPAQQGDGSVLQSTETITRSGGTNLIIETTAVAIIAWLHDYKAFLLHVESAMKWLLTKCTNGRFGSTQGTILALKAIIAYEKVRASSSKSDAKFSVILNRKSLGDINVSTTGADPILYASFGDKLVVGKNSLEIGLTKGVSIPMSMSVEYFCEIPESSSKCVIDFDCKLNGETFEEGSGGEIAVSLKNLSEEKQGMVVAIVGLPGGLEPRHDQLKELVKAEKLDAYEIRGREVICYLRGMTIKEERKFKIDVIARIPGRFTGPASRAYLYYTDEFKKWISGMKCVITAK